MSSGATGAGEPRIVSVRFKFNDELARMYPGEDQQITEKKISKSLAEKCDETIGCWKFQADGDDTPQLRVTVVGTKGNYTLNVEFSYEGKEFQVGHQYFYEKGDAGLGWLAPKTVPKKVENVFGLFLRDSKANAVREEMMKELTLGPAPGELDVRDRNATPPKVYSVFPVRWIPYAKHFGNSRFRVESLYEHGGSVTLHFKGVEPDKQLNGIPLRLEKVGQESLKTDHLESLEGVKPLRIYLEEYTWKPALIEDRAGLGGLSFSRIDGDEP